METRVELNGLPSFDGNTGIIESFTFDGLGKRVDFNPLNLMDGDTGRTESFTFDGWRHE